MGGKGRAAALLLAAFLPVCASGAAQEDFVYALRFGGGKPVAGYEAWDAQRLHASPFRTDIWITDGGTQQNWNWCTACVLNMIDLNMLREHAQENPQEPYASIPVYCVDAVTDAKAGHLYRRVNLEQAAYFSPETAGRLRSIIREAFLHESDLDALSQRVNAWIARPASELAPVRSLTSGEAISAAQSAIWVLANGGRLDDPLDVYAGYDPPYAAREVVFAGEYAALRPTENTAGNITALTRYYLALAPSAPAAVLISGASFAALSAQAYAQTDGAFSICVEADVSAEVLAGSDIRIQAEAAGRMSQEQTVADGARSYVMRIDGLTQKPECVRVTIRGQQKGDDVYLFVPEGGRGASQTMAGISRGTLPVHACAQIDEVPLVPAIPDPPEDAARNLPDTGDRARPKAYAASFALCAAGLAFFGRGKRPH